MQAGPPKEDYIERVRLAIVQMSDADAVRLCLNSRGVARRRLHHCRAADEYDVRQAAFLATLNGERPWDCGTLVEHLSRVMDDLAHNMARRAVERTEQLPPAVVENLESPEVDAETKVCRDDMIERARSTLPEHRRLVFDAIRDGKTGQEIMHEHNLSERAWCATSKQIRRVAGKFSLRGQNAPQPNSAK